MKTWLNGNVVCEESKRYVSNFISIHRFRPDDDGEDGLANPDDLVEDEDVCVTRDMLDEVLDTRIAGKTRANDDLDVLGDGHHMNSSEAVELGRDICTLSAADDGSATRPVFDFKEPDVKRSMQSAKQSRSKEQKFGEHTKVESRDAREAALSHRQQATREDVAEWLQALKVRTREDGRRLYVNAAQYEAVAKVAKKVQEELPNRVGAAPAPSDPLRWVVHGGPGTGKSHVVRDVIKNELFDQVLHWQQGLDYEVIALQAVMADLLKGDTIHHACGIPVRKKGAEGDVVIQAVAL